MWLGRGFQNEERERENGIGLRKEKEKKRKRRYVTMSWVSKWGAKKREKGREEDWGGGFKKSKKRKV